MITEESKQYSFGSDLPLNIGNNLIIYTASLCPHSERIRLILNFKHVAYEVININSKSIPEWFLRLNPMGEIPAVQFPGKTIIFDSTIMSEYLDELYPGTKRILPDDPHEKAKQKLSVQVILNRLVKPFYNILHKLDSHDALSKSLDIIEQHLVNKFFSGEESGYIDLMIWPWFERMPALAQARGNMFEFDLNRYPKLIAWSNLMLKIPEVKATTYSKEMLIEFFESMDNKISKGDFGFEMKTVKDYFFPCWPHL